MKLFERIAGAYRYFKESRIDDVFKAESRFINTTYGKMYRIISKRILRHIVMRYGFMLVFI